MASGKFCDLKIKLVIGFNQKTSWNAGKAVMMLYLNWLNTVTSRIFPPTANFENFKIHLYFVCLPATCLSVVRPG